MQYIYSVLITTSSSCELSLGWGGWKKVANLRLMLQTEIICLDGIQMQRYLVLISDNIMITSCTIHQGLRAGASIHFSDWGGGGKSKKIFKIFGALCAQSRNIKHLWQNSISFKFMVFVETEVGQRSTELLSRPSRFLVFFISETIKWLILSETLWSLTLALPKTIPSTKCTKLEIMKIIINTYILSHSSRFSYPTSICMWDYTKIKSINCMFLCSEIMFHNL